MVLNDITRDYMRLMSLLNDSNTFIQVAQRIAVDYRDRLKSYSNTYLESARGGANLSELNNNLSNLLTDYYSQIGTLNTEMRTVAKLLAEVERMVFQSPQVQGLAEDLVTCLNDVMDICAQFVNSRVTGQTDRKAYFRLLHSLDTFERIYRIMKEEHELLAMIEDELQEPIPEQIEKESITYLDFHSMKQGGSITAFAKDLQLLSECLQQFEMLYNPTGASSIFLQKVESGSFHSKVGSNKVNFSIFPDLVNGISEIIHTWRLTPYEQKSIMTENDKTRAEAAKLYAEARVLNAEAEEKEQKNRCNRLAMLHLEKDKLCELLSLDSAEPEAVEKMERVMVPLMELIIANPEGTINGVPYNIVEEVKLLEKQE